MLYNNNVNNPYLNNQLSYNPYFQPQKQEVVRVNGKNGAEAYQLPPNSSILLLDETASIVWLKMTDGAGYPTLSPYDINPHKEESNLTTLQSVDFSALEERVKRLEEMIDELNKSNVEPTQSIKRITK